MGSGTSFEFSPQTTPEGRLGTKQPSRLATSVSRRSSRATSSSARRCVCTALETCSGGAGGAFCNTGGGGGGGLDDGGSTEVTRPVAGSMLTMARLFCTRSQKAMSCSVVEMEARVSCSASRTSWPTRSRS